MKSRARVIAAVAALLSAAAAYFLLPAGCPEPARRNAAVFVIAAMFWAFEIVPLYATSLLVVLLNIFLFSRAGGAISAADADYKLYLGLFADPVLILFLGGLTLAALFRKYGLDRWIVARMVLRLGRRPFGILLGIMGATAAASMWMSNTATTALMLILVGPLLVQLAPEDPFRRALVLAVPFAANIGGIATPVGTPANAVAMGLLDERGISVNFLSWMAFGVPLALALVVFTAGILRLCFPPRAREIILKTETPPALTRESRLVLALAALTVLLWLTSPVHHVPEAAVALLCLGLAALSGLFTAADLKNLDWEILLLMWGGMALGEGMERSGLTRWITGLPFLEQQGMLYIVLMCVITVFLSTFISNTATVNLIGPLAIGASRGDPVVTAVVVALSSSFDLALPISTPPMAMAYGTGEVRVRDMLKAGIFFTLAANGLLLLAARCFFPFSR